MSIVKFPKRDHSSMFSKHNDRSKEVLETTSSTDVCVAFPVLKPLTSNAVRPWTAQSSRIILYEKISLVTSQLRTPDKSKARIELREWFIVHDRIRAVTFPPAPGRIEMA